MKDWALIVGALIFYFSLIAALMGLVIAFYGTMVFILVKVVKLAWGG